MSQTVHFKPPFLTRIPNHVFCVQNKIQFLTCILKNVLNAKIPKILMTKNDNANKKYIIQIIPQSLIGI
jgi:hypothetical protein